MPGSKKGRKVNAKAGGMARIAPKKQAFPKREMMKLRLLDLLRKGYKQEDIATALNVSEGTISKLKKEALAEWIGDGAARAKEYALEMAHGHMTMFERMRDMALERSLRVRTVEEDGEKTRIITVEDFEALRKLGDGAAKQSERFARIFGTDAPVKVKDVTPGLSPDELADIVKEGNRE